MIHSVKCIFQKTGQPAKNSLDWSSFEALHFLATEGNANGHGRDGSRHR